MGFSLECGLSGPQDRKSRQETHCRSIRLKIKLDFLFRLISGPWRGIALENPVPVFFLSEIRPQLFQCPTKDSQVAAFGSTDDATFSCSKESIEKDPLGNRFGTLNRDLPCQSGVVRGLPGIVGLQGILHGYSIHRATPLSQSAACCIRISGCHPEAKTGSRTSPEGPP